MIDVDGMYNRTDNAIKGMIQNSLDAQRIACIVGRSKECRKDAKYMGDFLKEFCTVEMGTQRRSGKTTALAGIKRILGNSCILVTNSDDQANAIKDSCKVDAVGAGSLLRDGFYIADEVDCILFDGRSYTQNVSVMDILIRACTKRLMNSDKEFVLVLVD